MASTTTTNYERILEKIREILGNAIPNAESIDLNLPFLEMGANSLVLMDVQRTIERDFGVTISIGQFFEELTTIEALIGYIDTQISQESTVKDNGKVTDLNSDSESAPSITSNASASLAEIQSYTGSVSIEGGISGDLEHLFKAQIQTTAQVMQDLIRRQLDFLQKSGSVVQNQKIDAQAANGQQSQPASNGLQNHNASASTADTSNTPKKSDRPESAIQPQRMLSALETRARGLTPQQQKHLEDLIKAYTQKTGKSKAHTAKYRKVLSDSRAAIGFRFTTKEMLYPIVSNRSKGARIWDLDGNEYIDISMGQGVTMFGHHPEFIEKELAQMVKEGVEMGPRPEHVGDVAELISEMTGFERITFTNSGTEAVMAAMRLARASTGRDKIVSFEGAWHGHADSVMGMLVDESSGTPQTKPVSPGTPLGAVADQYVLKFNDPDSLDFIKRHGDQIAAILVEPVQSRNPSVQPREFLHQLRKLSTEVGALLVFDEMITGFRSHPGGAQHWFDVQADMATYGKVVGGGLPIGVVAGPASIMDRIDGGHWDYGDTSYPEVSRVVFGGTFCQHPLAMTASLAALRYLKEQGPKLQEKLNERTTRLANELNAWFEQEEVPIQVAHFASLFRFEFNTNLELLFYHMNLRGVFVWEWRNCFLSTAHTDEDITRVIEVVKESVLAMREGGFIPPKEGSAKSFPLSSAQAQLAALDALSENGSKAYQVGALLKLEGTVQVEKISKAVEQVILRHDALRSTIQNDVQQVHSDTLTSLKEVDLSDGTLTNSFEKWLQKHAETKFDLAKGPLFKVELLHLSEKEHYLSLKAHHIILDGLSMNIVIQEIAEHYNALVRGESIVTENPMQFRDYLSWQNAQSFEKEKEAWLNRFPNGLPELQFPTWETKPAQPSYKGGRISKPVSFGLFSAVRALSKQEGMTPFMFLFSVYSLWLHRVSGQDEVVVGIPVAGRSAKGAETLVGYATHLIPIRSTLGASDTVQAYMKKMRSELLNGYQHQDYPFSRLMEELSSDDSTGNKRNSIRAVFNLDRPGKAPEFEGINVKWQSQPIHYTAFDWVMNLTEIGDNLHMECDVNLDLLDSETAESHTNSFLQLLSGIVEDLTKTAASIPLLDPGTVNSWLHDWNQTEQNLSPKENVVSLIDKQVKKSKNEIALSWKTGQKTYTDFGVEVDRFAATLLQKGLRKGDRVAIFMRRSPEMVQSILGVMKAGGVFVPIDPSYPQARVEELLTDSEPGFVVLDSRVMDLPSTSANVQRIDWSQLNFADTSDQGAYPELSHEDLAYCLYTSGSTGKPKGTLITHGGLLNYLLWAAKNYQADKGIGVPLHSSIGFDATLTSLFTPLISGKMLYLLPDTGQDLLELTELLNDSSYSNWSMLKVTPSHLEYLSHQIPADRFSKITSTLILGGEALHDAHIETWLEHAPKTTVYNEYGPTETVVGCAVFAATSKWLKKKDRTASVPIGRPIANTKLFVLDPNLEPVPPGVPGELFISGQGVAKGYLNREELTEQKFIDLDQIASDSSHENSISHFSSTFDQLSKPYNRFYRTGDRVVLMPDGELLFLGRTDDQIKLRGYRIEPEEIRLVMRQINGISDALVKIDESGSEPRLIGYYLSNSPIPSEEISGQLRSQLPSHMVPADFIHLSEWPMTSNGKIDVKALTSSMSQSVNQQLSVPNSVEKQIQTLWEEILQKNGIGIHQNFFDIGGHSLLVIPLMEKINAQFKVEFKAAQIFQYPTIQAQAGVVSSLVNTLANGQANGQDRTSSASLSTRKKRRSQVVRTTRKS